MKANVTQERLKERLMYDPDSGAFTWLPTPVVGHGRSSGASWNARFAGKVAGVRALAGDYEYTIIRVDGVNYPAHRLAWLFVHGDLPASRIRHRNGDRRDNRMANLMLIDGEMEAA